MHGQSRNDICKKIFSIQKHLHTGRRFDRPAIQTDMSEGTLTQNALPDGEDGPPDLERRLHLRAFDYWRSLCGDRLLPAFSDLSPAGLAPFKAASLLLERRVDGTVLIRFIGSDIARIAGPDLVAGDVLGTGHVTGFSRALLAELQTMRDDINAAEFEYVEVDLASRGVLLPLSAPGGAATFTLIVAGKMPLDGDHLMDIPEEDAAASGHDAEDAIAPAEVRQTDDGDTENLHALMDTARAAAGTLAHPGLDAREQLYDTLAAALALHEMGEVDAAAYRTLLRDANLKRQARAPFTPALKLVFGKEYDKTRLTEYAAAIAYARRFDVASDGLAAFLREQPGGIKGCVKAEREAKRGESGSPAARRQAAARRHLRQMPARKLKNMDISGEFGLVLVRRKAGGGTEAVAAAEVADGTIDAVIRRIAGHQKDKTS